MRKLLVAFALVFALSGSSQRLGFSLLYGSEYAYFPFESLYTFEAPAASISFNQMSYLTYTKYGFGLSYEANNRFKNQVNFLFMPRDLGSFYLESYFARLSADPTHSNLFADREGSDFETISNFTRSIQIKDRFSVDVYRKGYFECSALAGFSFNLMNFKRNKNVLDQRLAEYKYYHELVGTTAEISDIGYYILDDFFGNHALAMPNQLTLEAGLNVKFHQLNLAFSYGYGWFMKSESQVFKNVHRYEFVLAADLFTKHLEGINLSSDDRHTGSTNSVGISSHFSNIYIRYTQPIAWSLEYDESGVYAENYETTVLDNGVQNNFGFNESALSYYPSKYNIYHIDRQPVLKVIPGISAGLGVKLFQRMEVLLEACISGHLVDFGTIYYSKESPLTDGLGDEDILTTIPYVLNDYQTRAISPNLALQCRMIILQGRSVSYFIGLGGKVDFYFVERTDGWINSLYDRRTGLLRQKFALPFVSFALGAEWRGISVELAAQRSTMNLFADDIASLGAVQGMNVSVKIPVYKFSW